MRFSVPVPGLTLYAGNERAWVGELTGDDIVELAQVSERLGYDHLRVSEHIVMHRDFVGNMGPRWSNALASVGVLVGATERIRIVPLIVVPYHNPIELAQSIATLDFLSGGRVVVLAAVGYMKWEYELLGVPYADRGRIMDEYLAAMIELWTSDEPEFHGQFVDFENIVFEPKPVQKPYPTLWLAGYAKAVMRRLARVGDGWITYNTRRDELPEMLEYLYEQPEYQANPRPMEIGMQLYEFKHDPVSHELLEPPRIELATDAVLEQVHELAALGVTTVRADMAIGMALGGDVATRDGKPVPPPRSKEEYIERLQWFAEAVLPAAAGIEPAAPTGRTT